MPALTPACVLAFNFFSPPCADFAVGAPFHDTGKVYIWVGSKKGISEEPSQVNIPQYSNFYRHVKGGTKSFWFTVLIAFALLPPAGDRGQVGGKRRV